MQKVRKLVTTIMITALIYGDGRNNNLPLSHHVKQIRILSHKPDQAKNDLTNTKKSWNWR